MCFRVRRCTAHDLGCVLARELGGDPRAGPHTPLPSSRVAAASTSDTMRLPTTLRAPTHHLMRAVVVASLLSAGRYDEAEVASSEALLLLQRVARGAITRRRLRELARSQWVEYYLAHGKLSEARALGWRCDDQRAAAARAESEMQCVIS